MVKKGVYFGEIHSYNDLGLVLSSVDISPAKPKTNYVDIPGGDGSADLTNVHGEVKFSMRTMKFTFVMNPSGDLSEAAWESKKTEISNLLNGIHFERITLDKDSDYFYTGRCTVDSWQSDRRVRTFVVSASVFPYKHKQAETVATFDLSAAARNVTIQNSRKSVIPEIVCSNDNCIVACGGYSVSMKAGTHKFLEIQFVEGANIVSISGTGTVSFRFREGDL